MKKNNNNIDFKTIWNVVMAIIYLVLAYFVTFTTNLLPNSIESRNAEYDDFVIVRIFLGIAFLLYGIFRLYRVIKGKNK